MGYSVGYHTGDEQACSRPGCQVSGGNLLAGQLKITVQDSDNHHSRHLECVSRDQNRNIRKRLKTPNDLTGFRNLKKADKEKLKTALGWNDDSKGNEKEQNNNNHQKQQEQPKTGRNEDQQRFNAPPDTLGSQRPPDVNVPNSWYTEGPSWGDAGPSWGDPEPPQPGPPTATTNTSREGDRKRRDARGNAPPESRYEPVPALAPTPIPSEADRTFKAPRKQDARPPKPPVSVSGESIASRSRKQDPPSSLDTPGPAAPAPVVSVDLALLMRLELEDKEAEARLAEAELLLAETRVKVETARRAVVAQKLTMARAGVAPSI